MPVNHNDFAGRPIVQQYRIPYICVDNVVEEWQQVLGVIFFKPYPLKCGNHFKGADAFAVTAVAGHRVIYIGNGNDSGKI